MHLTKDYIDIQVNFVKKLCEIDRAPYALYFMFYADAPLLLKIDYKTWHPNTAQYLEFCEVIKDTKNLTEIIFEYASEKERQNPVQPYLTNPYGFFHSHIIKGVTLEMHTLSELPMEKDKVHFLDHRRFEETKDKLYKMIKDQKEKYPTLKYVMGNSWLYNIESYKRLFPNEYLATAKPNTYTFHGYALWGQFLNKELEVKPDIKEEFYKKLERSSSFNDCMDAFPYKVLSLKSNIEMFIN